MAYCVSDQGGICDKGSERLARDLRRIEQRLGPIRDSSEDG
jgi:hypothetical protein